MNTIDYNGLLGLPDQMVTRIQTCEDEVDWLYGHTVGSDGIAIWGLPTGKISVWAGEPGVGKSRAAKHLAVMTMISGEKRRANIEYKVKYFYLEEGMQPLSFITDGIRTERPNLVVIDSINTIKEYAGGSEKNVILIIDELRKVCNETGAHILILAQLTKEGTVRGSNVLLHLPDIVMRLRRGSINMDGQFLANDGCFFTLETTGKHRYGPTGQKYVSLWGHLAEGVGICSDYRLYDEVWCRTHNFPLKVWDRYRNLKKKN